MKKIAAILLSLALSLSLLGPARAADSGAPVLKIESGSGNVRLVLDGLGDQPVYSIQLELTAAGTGTVAFTPAVSGKSFGTCKTEGDRVILYLDSFQSLNDGGSAALGTLYLGGNTVAGEAVLTLLGSDLAPIVTQRRIGVERVPGGSLTPSTPSGPSVPSGPSGSGGGYVPGGTGPSTLPPGTGPSAGSGGLGQTVTVTPAASVQGGTAFAVVGTAMGNEIVSRAVSGSSGSVVIAPGITGSVTRTEVTIPAATVGQLGRQTGASLTVSTPVAAVTIPNSGLNSLSAGGGSVVVSAGRSGNTVELQLTAGGGAVEAVPGGVILTLDAPGAGPGAVAVRVLENGVRVVVRKSVAVNGRVTVPLDGPGRVEIVDNSKYFADVPAASWAAGAVAFASAHELFNGTAPAQFSPDQPMSRGMLAVVLHNLEGNPAQAAAGAFTDVNPREWYAGGVAWAASKGIVGGYGDGRFGPEDNITREQLAVMLWRYAGSPAAAGGTLAFADADRASGWALDALRWATGQGIINGKGGGVLDPAGQATRAETAQMLKNLLEKQ